MSVSALLASVATLEPLLAAQMPDGRRRCRLPERVAEALIERGLFRLWIPTRYEGSELPLQDALRIYEAVARLDGAAGWAVMIGAGGGLFAAYLEPEAARRLFAPRAAVVAGSGAPTGTAERVVGGYRATGRWRYASGAHYASVFTANCRVLERGEPVLVNGEPLIRAMSFAPSDVRIIETWDTTGLRATGSHDITVREVFVPEAASFSVFSDAPRERGPLYRLPFGTLTELPVSAVALGIARHALIEFEALSRAKPSPFGGGALSAQPRIAEAILMARLSIDAATARLYALAEVAWATATSPGAIDATVLADCTTGSAMLVARLVGAIGSLAPLAGMNALHREDPFSVAWQDLAAAAAHYSVSPLNAG
jgi:alkylation response protein AidB-like acyl-CoA dehydrogenase